MNINSQISKEDFESLLNWFSTDSEEAGIEYENIRQGLIRYFRFRGCSDCQALADETINRVAIKLDTLDLDNDFKKITIFYGFALNIYREYLREAVNTSVRVDRDFFIIDSKNENDDDDDAEIELECLEKCLKKLSKQDHYLITQYFSAEKSEKIKIRKKLAEDEKITPNALHVRVYRIRKQLRKCINKCLKK